MKRNLTDAVIRNLKTPAAGQVEVFDLQLPGFGIRAGTSGRKVFFVMYRVHGKQVRETLKPTYPTLSLKRARQLAGKSVEQAGGGIDPRADRVQRVRGGFAAVADEFVERYAKRHQKPTTLRETERYIEVLKSAWGSTQLQSIRRADVLRLLDALVDAGKTTSANRLLATTRKLFGWCVERGYLELSPCVGIRPPGKESSRSRVLTSDELGAVWRACDALAYPWGSFVQLMIASGGQRERDVALMRWDQVHGDVWRIEEPTKSSEPHTVPLSTLALEVLGKVPRFDGPHVFTTTAGAKGISAFSKAKRNLDAKIFEQAKTLHEKHGGPAPAHLPAWRFHDIRRTVSTAFGEHLGQLPYIAEAVQNRKSGTIKGVMAVYNRARYEADKRAALEAWATFVRAAASAGKVVPLRRKRRS